MVLNQVCFGRPLLHILNLTQICHSVCRIAVVIGATTGLNMRMDVSLGRKVRVREEGQRWTAGGAGCSGTVHIASVCVTNRDQSPIDTSI
jgi:hypothetical protein